MKPILAGLVVFVAVSQSHAEYRTVLVQVEQDKEKKASVTIHSDEKKEQKSAVSVGDAVKVIGAMNGWGSQVGVYVTSNRAIRGADLKKLLDAVNDNPWLDLEYFGRAVPKVVADHFLGAAQGTILPARKPGNLPGSASSLPALASETATVIVAVAREKATIQSRSAAHLSTQRSVGKGAVIEGGGDVFFARCRQKFQVVTVLHGKGKPGDRVLEYGFVEKTEGFPLPAVQEPIPEGAELILLLGEKGDLLKALPDTQENRKAVRNVLAAQKGG